MNEDSDPSVRIQNAVPETLAQVMSLSGDREATWLREDLEAILKHQLSAPVVYELSSMGSDTRREAASISTVEGACIATFADLFRSPEPPLRLLEITKDFAKASTVDPERPLPPEVATIIYLACIVLARTRHGRRISRLDDTVLRRNLQWAIGRPWLDDEIRTVLKDGLRKITATP